MVPSVMSIFTPVSTLCWMATMRSGAWRPNQALKPPRSACKSRAPRSWPSTARLCAWPHRASRSKSSLPKAPFAYQANGVSPQGEALALDVRPSVNAPRQPAAPDDDPEDLIYSTFLGGSGDERGGYDLALDTAGRAIVTGWTWSSDFPTTPGAFDPSLQRRR